MKKNLFALAAVVFAITLSSFTTANRATYYLAYVSGNQFLAASYTSSSSTRIDGTGKLNWIAVESADAIIDNAEVSAVVNAENLVAGGSPHLLSNEAADTDALDVKE